MNNNWIILLINGLISGGFAFASYSFAVKKHNKDILDDKITNLKRRFDECHHDISSFLTKYLNEKTEDNIISKQISITSLDYKVESIREDIRVYSNTKLGSAFYKFSILISDTGYERDSDKSLKNLHEISSLIIEIRKELDNIKD